MTTATPTTDAAATRSGDHRWTVPAGHAGRYGRRSPQAEPQQAQPGQRLRLAEGLDLLGASEGSGYVEEHHLARTGAGRVVQLTDLLFLVAEAAGPDGHSDEEVAAAVSERYGRTVTAENVRTLADKLRPLGVLAEADGSEPEVEELDPLLALRLRSTLLGPTGVRRLTAPLRPLFFLPVVLAALVGLVLMDLWLFLSHGLAQGLRESLQSPALFLLAFGLVVVSAAFHECGHATACSVGGGEPGRMGAGIYLAWPAFYTDVTDAYRLDRRSRLRTDLGGVYFSCLLVLGLGAVYLATGFEPLLLIAFLMQIEVVHQMLPFLRLDGYYVVSDLVGVPDLFRRTGPVLRSMLPGRSPEPSVVELKPWVRNVVRAWVLTVVPVLLFNVGMILLNVPRTLSTAWDSGARLVGEMSGAGATTVAVDVVQLVFLVIPIAGLGYTFVKLFGQLGRAGWTSTRGRPVRRGGFLLLSALAVAGLALVWWPDARYTPYRPGESGSIPSQASALRYAGQGAPLFRSPRQAQQPLPALPATLERAYQPAPASPPTAAPAATAAPSPSTPGPSPSAGGGAPSPSAPSTPGPGTSPGDAPTPGPAGPAPTATSGPAPAPAPAGPSPAGPPGATPAPLPPGGTPAPGGAVPGAAATPAAPGA